MSLSEGTADSHLSSTDILAQLCFALNGQRQEGTRIASQGRRKLSEAELAREMYANATAEKIDLLRMLKRDHEARQGREQEARAIFEGQLEVGLGCGIMLTAQVLQDATQVAASASTSFQNRVHEQDELVSLLRGAVAELGSHKHRLWSELEHILGETLGALVQTAQQDVDSVFTVASERVSSTLRGAAGVSLIADPVSLLPDLEPLQSR